MILFLTVSTPIILHTIQTRTNGHVHMNLRELGKHGCIIFLTFPFFEYIVFLYFLEDKMVCTHYNRLPFPHSVVVQSERSVY